MFVFMLTKKIEEKKMQTLHKYCRKTEKPKQFKFSQMPLFSLDIYSTCSLTKQYKEL